MATIAEQLKSAVVTDSLKYANNAAAETAGWKKLVWAASISTFNETGWHPPSYTKHEPDGSQGGAWLSTKKQTGGSSYAYLVSPTFGASQAGGGAEFRQRAVWLYTTGESTANGYQLRCKDTTSGTSTKYMLVLSKYTAGVPTLLKEVEVEIEANGGIAVVSSGGKIAIYIRKTEIAAWVLAGEEVADTTFKEGFSGIDGNGSNPTVVNFATGVIIVGIAPTVATLAATVLKTSAKLKGTVNPNNLATNYWFEYGRTKEYGFKTATKAAGSGAVAVAVENLIEGLQPGTLYHFRLVAESSAGLSKGADTTLTTTGSKVRRRRKPDLGLDIEVETPDSVYRLPANSKRAKNLPRNLTIGTTKGEGFGISSLNLSRPIFKEHPDINLLDSWRAVGRNSGDVAYEGRLQSNPRDNDPEEILEIALIGWASYLAGRKISPLIIDPRTGGWQDASIQRRLNLIKEGYAPAAASVSAGFQDSGALAAGLLYDFTGTTATATFHEGAEQWFYAGGQDIGHLYFDQIGDETTTWLKYGALAQDDVGTGWESSPNYSGLKESLNQGVHAKIAGMKYAILQAFYTNNGYAGGMTNRQLFNNIKLVGTHGLTLRGEWPNVGFYLTDIVRFILETYYPKVKLAGEENKFVVQGATWHDNAATGYEIIKQLNNLALWELNVWEDRVLHHERADLTKYDWQFKTTDPGVKVKFQGDSIENFANGCSVQYTGFDGITHTLTPSDHPELRDESENNPYNKHNEYGWTDCSVPYQCDEVEALQFGRVYLADFNRPKRPGVYEIQGYIEDAQGQWHQGWKPRNGETCVILDFLNDEPRLITSTNWNDETKILTITVDASDKLLDAIVARQQIAREARGL